MTCPPSGSSGPWSGQEGTEQHWPGTIALPPREDEKWRLTRSGVLDGLTAMSQDAAVSLRTAWGFVESLRDGREIWLGGERVVDVTAHPLLRGAALTIAALSGLQHRPDLQDRLSLPIDESEGERIGYSHIQPRTRDDLRRRREMIKLWADENGGMLGRTPDFMNMMFAGYAAAHEYFAQGGAQFGDNIRRYHDRLRRADLCLTHTLVHPDATARRQRRWPRRRRTPRASSGRPTRAR